MALMVYSTPTYAMPTTFFGKTLGEATQPHAPQVAMVGIPFDLATSNRPGARGGPDAVRLASRTLYDGAHPVRGINPLALLEVNDCGNLILPLGRLEESLHSIETQVADFPHLVAVGGDHMATYPLLKALHQRHGALGLVQFDAHTDAYPTCFGEPWGHGCVMRRAIEDGLVDPKRMVQIGIRATVDPEILAWLTEKGVTIFSAEDVHMSSPGAVAARVRDRLGSDKPAYLTFDIDGLDPSQAPGTGTPEVGGLFTWQAMSIIRQMTGINFVGMDVMEIAPAYDHAEITAFAGATMIYEYLTLVAARFAKG